MDRLPASIPESIASRLDEHAKDRPDQVALRCAGDMLTYASLLAEVRKASAVISEKTAKGDRVALDQPNSLTFMIWFLSISGTGRIAMVLDPGWTDEVRRAVLERSPPALIITEDTPLPATGAEPFINEEVSGEDDFYIGFTSGSTGLPKGFRRSHRSWVLSFEADRIEFGITPQDRILSPGPLVHSLFLYAVVHGLYVGATVELLESYSPKRLLERLEKANTSHLYVVPAMLPPLLDRGQAAPALKVIASGGAKLSPETRAGLLDRFPGLDVIEFFGASETSYIAVARSSEGAPATSVGRPFATVSVRIVRDDGSPAGVNEEGRLYIKSALVFTDYEGGDAGRLLRDGDWISVGDRCRQDAEGFLYLEGRENRMIVSSGRNIFPEAIEDALNRIDGVRACAVLGLTDPRREQELVAVLEPEKEQRLVARELRRELGQVLRTHEIPRRFFTMAALPRTTSGKIKFALLDEMGESAWTPLT